jgi:hypothetical protein
MLLTANRAQEEKEKQWPVLELITKSAISNWAARLSKAKYQQQEHGKGY